MKGNQMVMVSIFGQMAVSIKEHSKMVLDKAMVYGRNHQATVINTKVIMSETRNKVMASSIGHQAISTKVITSKISGMAMEKCFGMMAVIIKDSGAKAIRKEKALSILKRVDYRKVASNRTSW